MFFAVTGAVVLRWLRPHVESKLFGPVLAYVLALSFMAASAIGTHGASADRIIPIAAAAFWLSDLSVATDVFVRSSFSNKAWGLPLYYVAQLLFAFSIASNG